MILRGQKVMLRYPKLSDAKILSKGVSKLEIGPNIRVHWKNPTLKQEKDWIKTVLKQNRKKEGATFVVLDKKTQKIIGSCGFNTISLKDKYAVAGWWLKKEYWGQGYFQDFANAVLNYGFKKLKLNKVTAHAFSFNVRSQKSIQKLGFKPEGVERQKWIKNGKPIDNIIYGMLRKEWKG